MGKVKSAVIGVFHHDCQTSLSTEKFPGIWLEQLSPVVYLSKKPASLDYSLIWRIGADTQSEIEEYLSFVKQDKATKKLHILEQKGCHAAMLLRFKGAHSTYDAVLSNGVTPASSVIAKEGYEIYQLITEEPKNIGNMLSELSCIGEVKIMRVGDFAGMEDVAPFITDKQADALKLALINGYYEWPRGSTLEKIARIAKVSRRSIQERLRRAEAKLIPYALRDYLKRKQ